MRIGSIGVDLASERLYLVDMAIWSYTDRWEKAPLYRKNHDGIAVVCGSSPWLLKDGSLQPHWFRIGVNNVHRVLPLDAWVGMDDPNDHGIDTAKLPCMKFYRGCFADTRIGSVAVNLMPSTYFVDVKEGISPLPIENNMSFLWLKSSIIVAIQMAMYMGYSRIILNGVDFERAGEYADGSTCGDAETQQEWYDGLAVAVKSITGVARGWGFNFYSTRNNMLGLPHFLEAS